MEHPSHEHSLILNENYVARKGDVCRACNEQIVSGKSSVYSCSRSSIIHENSSDEVEPDHGIYAFLFGRTTMIIVSCAKFFLHKSCAELPAYIPNPKNPKESLKLCFNYSPETLKSLFHRRLPEYRCNVCCIPLPWDVIQFLYFSSDTADIYVCLKCALFHFQQSLEDRKIEHPAHSQHPLALIQRPSSFKCDACKLDDINNKDSSYRCTKCQFWMHKSCGDAPTTFQFQFHHQHPLVLSFSLPQVYHKFMQHCRLCKETLNRLDWIYYCCYCRFFAHFRCARSNQMWSILDSGESEKDPNPDVVHLPAADELSMNQLGEQFVKEMSSTLYNNNNNISSSTNSIKHWAHDEHPLQLTTTSELNNQKEDDKIICDGCVKPIRTDDDDPFYGCVPCKYFLHTFCAELPREIEDYPRPGMRMSAFQYKEKYGLVPCDGCGVRGNGIFFRDSNKQWFHIGCAALLPKMIKHEAHSHKLNPVPKRYDDTCCQACGGTFWHRRFYRCDQCDYNICGGCIMKSSTINHPWDPHPMHLIYDPSMVIGDHVHDFNCEFCSQDIDTNFWFYHCSDCDLSFHLDTCFETSRYQQYSGIKFGATDIIIQKLHPHSLTFVLNKKVRNCEKCGGKLLGEPVLECTCGVIFCTYCA